MAEDIPVDETLATTLQAGLDAADLAGLARHFAAFGATLPRLAWSPGMAELDEPVLRTLLAYWTQLPRGPRAPLSAGLAPRGMKGALSHVMLMDALDGGRDFRYRVYGSAIAARSGRDITGRTVTEVPLVPLLEFFLASYRACAARAEPLFVRHAPPVQVHIVSWDRLILPLDDGTGAIHRLLVGNVPTLRRRGTGQA
ncbi:MAG: PAS domain-containing protein [Sneathiellaceae bacterium]